MLARASWPVVFLAIACSNGSIGNYRGADPAAPADTGALGDPFRAPGDDTPTGDSASGDASGGDTASQVPVWWIDGFYFSTFFGGSDATWAATRDEYAYFDDFVISQHPITH